VGAVLRFLSGKVEAVVGPAIGAWLVERPVPAGQPRQGWAAEPVRLARLRGGPYADRESPTESGKYGHFGSRGKADGCVC
jgi:hypothetical protein